MLGTTMINRGLMIEECPSKGMHGINGESDLEEVPFPDDDDEIMLSPDMPPIEMQPMVLHSEMSERQHLNAARAIHD